MRRLSFSDVIGIWGGPILTVLLLALDKADKLNWILVAMLLGLALAAGVWTILSLAWTSDAGSREKKWIRIALLIAPLTLFYLLVGYWVIRNDTDTFSVEIEHTPYMSDNSNWFVNYWSGNGKVLVPSNMAVGLRFSNLKNANNHLDHYTFEIEHDGDWIMLSNLNTANSTAYFAYPDADHPSLTDFLKHARRLDFSGNGIDQQLARTDSFFGPKTIVRGWAFFSYPPNLRGITGRESIRLTVFDTNGRSQSYVQKADSLAGSSPMNEQKLIVLPGGEVDLSQMQIALRPPEFVTTPNCP